ncbi:Zn(2+)-responsive transcriptional regulator [Vibrio sp. WXL103]|uniref:Zn(2+)-responsive transcriptional regulator n=1 Tax=unclassified Vibrio TaxID=2614977 RepID=UPI003EC56453
MKPLTRGQLAKQLGISIEAIRFYEQQALLVPQRAENGYRQYDSDCVAKLSFILHAKDLGFSLEDIRELLSIHIKPEQHTCQEVKSIAQSKLQDIEQRIQHLQHMHDALQVINQRCCGGAHSAKNCTILTALAHTQPEGN